MIRVTALYRYPVKGYTPERCDSLTVLDEGRVAGDRVLAFRFADTGIAPDAWTRRHQHAVLVNTPGIARLEVRYDERVRRLAISLGPKTLAAESIDDSAGRGRLAAAWRYGRSLAGLAGRYESARSNSTSCARRRVASRRTQIHAPASGTYPSCKRS